MAELMLVNPRRKRAGRRRGRRRMTALQRQYFGKRRTRRSRRRVAALRASAAPIRRSRRMRRRLRAGRRRSRRRMGLGGGGRGFGLNSFLQRDLIPAGIGAVGALGLDVALGYVRPMLPAAISGPIFDPIVKIGGAIGIGWIAGQIGGRRMGEQVMAGAITVTLYDLIKGYARGAGLVSEYVGDYAYGYDQIGYVSPAEQVGEYVGDYGTGGDFVPV